MRERTTTDRGRAAPREVQELLGGLVRRLHQEQHKAERQAAEAAPRAHRLSRVFAGGLGYRYVFGPNDGRGRRVLFCWSLRRNVAGYFLGWREVGPSKKGVTKRDRWAARKSRRGVVALAERRQAAARLKKDQEQGREDGKGDRRGP